MSKYALASLSGVVVSYASQYFTFSFENVKVINIEDPLRKKILVSTESNDDDSEAIEYVSEGRNKPTIVTITVECKSAKMGEIGISFRNNRERYDTAGTLEILELDGSLFTFNSAVLNADPVARSVDSTNDTITYDLVFNCKPVISE